MYFSFNQQSEMSTENANFNNKNTYFFSSKSAKQESYLDVENIEVTKHNDNIKSILQINIKFLVSSQLC